MSKRAGLAELLGRAGADAARKGLRLADLQEILGDAMPELPRDAVGRHRLIRSLKARFGPNFRALPGVSGLVSEFEEEIEYARKLEKIRSLRASDFKTKGDR